MRQPARGNDVFSLREELDTAREHLRQIFEACGQGSEEILNYCIALSMTRQEASVMCLLVRRGTVSVEQFRTLVSKGETGMDSNILTTLVCRIRRKLQPLGVVIGTAWGAGYYINSHGRETIKKIVEDWRGTIGQSDPMIGTAITRARAGAAHHGQDLRQG